MKYFFYTGVLFCFLFRSACAQNKDTAIISALIRNIAYEQVEKDGKFYAGSFPSFRECAGVPHNFKSDNNIFFTAVSVFTLRNLLPGLTHENQLTVLGIIEKATPAFAFYKNQQGFPFYNFWPTGKGILPGTYFIKHFNTLLGMGEDADDAVMALMATNANDSICRVLKQRMTEVSNGKKLTIKSSFKKYRNIPAYSTYLGLHMPPDFDLGVHCNLLYFMLETKLPFTLQDSATIQLITEMVKNRDYTRSPVFISPYYARPPVLMYHLARLMGRFSIPALDKYRVQLVEDLQKELRKNGDLMDRLILTTSLLRLGQRPAPVNIPSISEFEKSAPDKFVFFQARAAFWYPGLLKKIFLHWSYLRYYFYCPVYNKILWLEYLLEKNKQVPFAID